MASFRHLFRPDLCRLEAWSGLVQIGSDGCEGSVVFISRAGSRHVVSRMSIGCAEQRGQPAYPLYRGTARPCALLGSLSFDDRTSASPRRHRSVTTGDGRVTEPTCPIGRLLGESATDG